jgi:hypothetical protein
VRPTESSTRRWQRADLREVIADGTVHTDPSAVATG